MICLQETWVESDIPFEDMEIQGYDIHFNNKGRRKGLAIFFKNEVIKHEVDVKEDYYQI